MPGHRLLYLVRHGAYEHDANTSVDDGSLTDDGRQQASLLADRLAAVRFDVVNHSTALRAVQTADVLAFSLADIPRNPDELLRECIPTIPADESLSPSQREFFEQLPQELRDEGPQQAKAALARYTEASETDSVELVVSHGNLINFFVASAMDAPEHGWLRPVDYHCGLTIIRYSRDAGPRVITYNDVGHLPVELRGVDYPDALRV